MSDNALQKLPTFEEITKELAPSRKNEQWHTLMNTNPPDKWVKTNEFAGKSKYLPIDKVEYLLDSIIGQWRREILSCGQLFNAVYAHVRIHYFDPVTQAWSYHDGLGACQIQTAKGASAAELDKINNNAVQMALPAAVSYAVKDACDNFGRLFGRDLNRKELMPFDPELNARFKEQIQGQLKDKFNKVNQEG